MIPRLAKPLKSHSFFLFGLRGTGKSTLLKSHFSSEKCLWIDLLDAEMEERFALRPQDFEPFVKGHKDIQWVIIDEVQKIPKLLDSVHRLIESTSLKFALTGSSARKLKRGQANLLAGRAFVYHLYPFSYLELSDQFELTEAMTWGMLPKVHALGTMEDKKQFLRSYSQTYLLEEIVAEQLVRNVTPFRKFLSVAAQCNGKIINIQNISRDVGVDPKTIQNHFQILEETWLGFFLHPFQNSFRKRLGHQPKFYFYDIGIVRSLAHLLDLPLLPQTSYYVEVFEHFIILEFMKLASYQQKDIQFSFLRTRDGVEVDLILEIPGKPIYLIEIKSQETITREDTLSLKKIASELNTSKAYCLSRDPHILDFDGVKCMPWELGIKAILNFKKIL